MVVVVFVIVASFPAFDRLGGSCCCLQRGSPSCRPSSGRYCHRGVSRLFVCPRCCRLLRGRCIVVDRGYFKWGLFREDKVLLQVGVPSKGWLALRERARDRVSGEGILVLSPYLTGGRGRSGRTSRSHGWSGTLRPHVREGKGYRGRSCTTSPGKERKR